MTADKLMAQGESHRGLVRKINQDRFLVKKNSGLLILAVADGMGGNAGEFIASALKTGGEDNITVILCRRSAKGLR